MSDEAVVDTSPVVGDWGGVLDAGVQLPLVFHIEELAGGLLTATMDSPDQGAFGLEVASATFDGARLELDIQVAQARYEGVLGESGAIEGTFFQGGATFPVTLTRIEDAAELSPARPQDPVPPFPYTDEDVTFRNDGAGVQLAGTLTIPSIAPPADGFPAVILVSGSGQQNRDEEIFNHRPFHVIADAFARAGVAVLRYDDRGIGGSGGLATLATATSRDFADDAAAAIMFASERPEINPGAVGILGHSEGGLIATMLAGDTPAPPVAPAFVIQLAGPGVSGRDLLLAQNTAAQRASGLPEETVEVLTRTNEFIYDALLSGRPREETWPEISQTLRSIGLPEEQIATQEQQLYLPWLTFFLGYDPQPALERYTVPVLALFGGLDLQVTLAENRPAMEAALSAAETDDVEVLVFDPANHLFQPATTGMVDEYGAIDITIMPDVLEAMTRWITARF